MQWLQRDGSLHVDFYEQWAVPPAQAVENDLRQWLADSGRFSAVVAPGSRLNADLVLEGELDTFVADPNTGMARVALALVLIDQRQGSTTVLLQRTVTAEVRLAGDRAAGDRGCDEGGDRRCIATDRKGHRGGQALTRGDRATSEVRPGPGAVGLLGRRERLRSVGHLRRLVGQACRVAPAIGHAETARAVWWCLGERLHRAAVALALIQADQRTVLAGEYRVKCVERAALDHREAANGDADADRCRLFRRNAAGEQQQDQHASHADSMRLSGKSMVCIAFAGLRVRRYGPPRRRSGNSSESCGSPRGRHIRRGR